MGKSFALSVMFTLHDQWRLLLDSDSQDILAYFFIQKIKISISLVFCPFPMSSHRYATITITACSSFLSKRVLKLEPGAWCPVSVAAEALPSEQGTLTSVTRLQIPVWFLNVKRFFVVVVLFLFLFLEAVCSILKNKSSFDYAIGWLLCWSKLE